MLDDLHHRAAMRREMDARVAKSREAVRDALEALRRANQRVHQLALEIHVEK